jgi:hypothetical protein
MNILKYVILSLFLLPLLAMAQSGPPAPGTGIYAIIDTNYQVGTKTLGYSKAKITLKNSTATKTTGVQFRLFYDNKAFSSASVALLSSQTNLNMQFLDNNAAGYMNVTLVYTGSSPTFSLGDGETFEVTFDHSSSSTFFSLSSIDSLKWTGTSSYSPYAATQAGTDANLSLYSYGGAWKKPVFNFRGTFTNVTGSGAQNLWLALEKKEKSGTTWTTHASYKTDSKGKFSLSELIDTTFYDVRLAVKGDTMNVGNVISTADAQLINQWVLGNSTPSGFDFYTGDVNGSNNITITDAYGVFGRIAGRFTSWPNSTKEIKFFTQSEFTTITGSPSTNFTSTISGTTNFTYEILPGQPDSITYYVVVPGDANGTGYHMARMTPITISPNPIPGYPSKFDNVVDMKVQYDFPTSNIEINLPSVVIKEGNLVELPVTVKTEGKEISSLQLSLLYDENLLEFKDLVNSDQSMYWLSAVNPMDGIVEWAGYDPSLRKSYSVPDNYNIFTLRFLALKPKSEWNTAPLYTSRKFAGDFSSKDLSIVPSNGILVVYKTGNSVLNSQEMNIFPNPTTGEFSVQFKVEKPGKVKLYVVSINGVNNMVILDKDMPEGTYIYNSNINNLADGIYVASLQTASNVETKRVLKNK